MGRHGASRSRRLYFSAVTSHTHICEAKRERPVPPFPPQVKKKTINAWTRHELITYMSVCWEGHRDAVWTQRRRKAITQVFDWTSWFHDANFPIHTDAVKPDAGTKALPSVVFKITKQCDVEREMFQNKALKKCKKEWKKYIFQRYTIKLLCTIIFFLTKFTEFDELCTLCT